MRKTIFNDYELDTSGTIFSFKSSKVLKPILDKSKGLYFIKLQIKTNQRKKFYMHKLVAEVFTPNYNHKNDRITFIDNDKSNYSLSNLSIEKDYYINRLPNDDETLFFEQNDPYDIVKHFLNSNWHLTRFNNAFTYDDAIQYLVMYLYKKTPLYLKKFKNDYKYRTFAFVIFKPLFRSQYYNEVNSYDTIIKTAHNTFDHEIDSSYISTQESIQLGYTLFAKDSFLNKVGVFK